MSQQRDLEERSWTQEETDGDRAIADMKRSLDRLRGQVGEFREKVGDGLGDDEQLEA